MIEKVLQFLCVNTYFYGTSNSYITARSGVSCRLELELELELFFPIYSKTDVE